MLAYRHGFHAGNHADVLKHVVLGEVLAHFNQKPKGWRYIDTHAGAGGYALDGEFAQKKQEYESGIGRIWGWAEAPPAVARYVQTVRAFNAGGRALRQLPGSPAIAHAWARPQDELRLIERHPTEHKILHSYLGHESGVSTLLGDGFAQLKTLLPPPTRRGVLLIDPPYELKTDYVKTLAAVREALERFAQAVVIVWLPQVQLVEAAAMPKRLKAACEEIAPKGWLHARLSVAAPRPDGLGLLGSHVFVANPPHGLHESLQAALPALSARLAQFEGASYLVEQQAR
jgi:23S rRNA (adenine2030-N6)-methyltransferase